MELQVSCSRIENLSEIQGRFEEGDMREDGKEATQCSKGDKDRMRPEDEQDNIRELPRLKQVREPYSFRSAHGSEDRVSIGIHWRGQSRDSDETRMKLAFVQESWTHQRRFTDTNIDVPLYSRQFRNRTGVDDSVPLEDSWRLKHEACEEYVYL